MAETDENRVPETEAAESESFDVQAERKAYLKKLKRWHIVKYICFFLAFMVGLLTGSTKNSMVFYIPAFAFAFAGGPILRIFAPVPHEALAGRLTKDETPTSTVALFLIFFAMVLLGYVMMTSDTASSTDNSSGSEAEISSSAETESE